VRIAAVSLPELRVEVVRAVASARAEPAPDAPLAIVVAPPPMTEAKLLGNTRLDVVSAEARALGIHPGQTIAQARARCASLAVRVVPPDAVRDELARLAEVALAFGATVAFSGSRSPSSTKKKEAPLGVGDVVWVDVTGCAHLHASHGNDGEAVLATRLASVFAGLGHTCAVAVADGPRVAAILARAAADGRAGEVARLRSAPARERHRAASAFEDPPVVVVPPGKNASALAPLPTSVLPLPEEDVRWLAKIGVRTLAELRALPRSALASRLGVHAAVVIALAEGEDRAPLDSYVPPEIPEEEATLEYGVEGADALTFVAKALTDRLAVRLAGRAVAASRVELDLTIDVALLSDEARAAAAAADASEAAARSERLQRLVVELPHPLSSASDLLAALRPKIERLVLRAPVLAAKLRAASLVHKPQAALSLFEAQPKAERALPRLVAELASDLGTEAVGKLSLGDAWTPEDRSRFVRLDAKPALAAAGSKGKKRRHMLSSVPEPTRILAEPILVSRDDVRVIRHLSRIEAVEWWKHLPGEGPKKGVDYVYAWVEDGPAWVELDRASRAARVRGWFD